MLKVNKICLAKDIALRLWLWYLWIDLILYVHFGLVIFVFGPFGALLGPGMLGTSQDCLQQISKSATLPLPAWGVLPQPTKAKVSWTNPCIGKIAKI